MQRFSSFADFAKNPNSSSESDSERFRLFVPSVLLVPADSVETSRSEALFESPIDVSMTDVSGTFTNRSTEVRLLNQKTDRVKSFDAISH